MLSPQTISLRRLVAEKLLWWLRREKITTVDTAALRCFLAYLVTGHEADGGRLITLSTPAGKRGWWWEEWRSDRPWRRFEVPASQCPRISAAFGLADIERAFDTEVTRWTIL